MRPVGLLLAAVACAACGARSGLLFEDAERDAGPDAGLDAGTEAGRDAGPDAGRDAGEDAGEDAGHDAGEDAAIPPSCGDGVVDPGEECDLGRENADIPAYAVRQASGLELLPQPVGSPSSSVAFYDFFSASAHTGFEAPRQANVFAYQETDRGARSLIFTFSQDDGGFDGTAELDVTGLGPGDPVLLSDDPGQPNELASSGPGEVHGSYAWFSNSDGGVLALPCPGVVRVDVTFTTFIDDWAWIEADGTVDLLSLDETAEIECNAEPSRCRTTCRFPACGDGFLDPGEECDDGDTQDGDRCPADCDLP